MKKKLVIIKRQTNQTGWFTVKIVDADNNERVLRCFCFDNEFEFINEKTERNLAISFAKNYILEQYIAFPMEYEYEQI